MSDTGTWTTEDTRKATRFMEEISELAERRFEALPVGLIVEALLQAAALIAVTDVDVDESLARTMHGSLDEGLERARKMRIQERAKLGTMN